MRLMSGIPGSVEIRMACGYTLINLILWNAPNH
jgi:hypothetical protein